jgi:hypothetical protein
MEGDQAPQEGPADAPEAAANGEDDYGPEVQVTEEIADQWRHNHTEQETQHVGEIMIKYR